MMGNCEFNLLLDWKNILFIYVTNACSQIQRCYRESSLIFGFKNFDRHTRQLGARSP